MIAKIHKVCVDPQQYLLGIEITVPPNMQGQRQGM
jgi:hypothetical protein